MSDFLGIDIIVLKIGLGLTLLALSSAVTGVFAYIKNDSLSADAIAHSTLPGVCLGFILSGTKSPLFMYGGALVFGIICQFLISKIDQYSKLNKDAVTAIVLTSLFGLGTILSDYISDNKNLTNKAGIKNFLFGQAASIQTNDIYFIGSITCVILIIVAIFGRGLKTLAFDPTQFKIYGWSENLVRFFFDLTLTLAVIIGIQTVGVVLMSALVITPAVCARALSNNFNRMIFIAVIVNIISVLLGTYFSYGTENPTGPWVILVLSIIGFISLPVGRTLKGA